MKLQDLINQIKKGEITIKAHSEMEKHSLAKIFKIEEYDASSYVKYPYLTFSEVFGEDHIFFSSVPCGKIIGAMGVIHEYADRPAINQVFKTSKGVILEAMKEFCANKKTNMNRVADQEEFAELLRKCCKL